MVDTRDLKSLGRNPVRVRLPLRASFQLKWRGVVVDNKMYRYNHIGIPTHKQMEKEKHLPDYDIYVAGRGISLPFFQIHFRVIKP